MDILLILEILGVILDVQGYIGNFGSVGVFASFWVFWRSRGYSSSFRSIWIILD